MCTRTRKSPHCRLAGPWARCTRCRCPAWRASGIWWWCVRAEPFVLEAPSPQPSPAGGRGSEQRSRQAQRLPSLDKHTSPFPALDKHTNPCLDEHTKSLPPPAGEGARRADGGSTDTPAMPLHQPVLGLPAHGSAAGGCHDRAFAPDQAFRT
ncbi:hypothetical protein XAC3810_780083 [Xanthomonas citri pv. citri]|uniref:Uncharacterized protein n=1 Tax=Xanthomonas citri pv. citri TaxID=611301 RepID=A0A0U5FMX7_XANCI|nr:hypothetical protein XAC902_1080033 [Xanthomonas citri pv. citri]CEE23987.1 hypothetical protein XAC908_1100034 [Xanthomonas citri pv. citri]CEE41145.1 hypothetical protein XAC3824_930034 [Xanthomonas citri pv. citri]CEE41196.1 hypothetical protein XAC9322_750083 [Xanthomonas citri pv. citri]CEE42704.1 hypothetical protein XAC1083_790035 [Xanthomonas citri pv. citri]